MMRCRCCPGVSGNWYLCALLCLLRCGMDFGRAHLTIIRHVFPLGLAAAIAAIGGASASEPVTMDEAVRW